MPAFTGHTTGHADFPASGSRTRPLAIQGAAGAERSDEPPLRSRGSAGPGEHAIIGAISGPNIGDPPGRSTSAHWAIDQESSTRAYAFSQTGLRKSGPCGAV